MSKRKITFGLSVEDIDRAIKELDEHKKDVEKKVVLFREKVGDYLAEEARKGFSGAIVDDLIKGGARTANVNVSVENWDDNMTVVIASGEDAVWVEFGAGVYHNGSVGSSPHPRGVELGMIIGGYGKGNGKKQTWGFYEDGELKLTHGTPVKMPMTTAVTTVCNEINKIAEEVFG